MKTKPTSEEAKNAVWAAYEALDEKHKSAITRHVAKTSPKLFKYWVNEADLVHGCDQRKVVGRAGAYGARLDKTLRDCEEGNFAADIFAIFLVEMKVVDMMLKGLPDDVAGEEFARLVDEKAAGSDSEFAKLAAAFVKCYQPERKPRTSPAEAADKEMSGLVARLDAHAVKLDGWAVSLRLTGRLPEEDVAATVGAANRDAARLTELMRGHREATGCPAREFKTPADVVEYVKELCAAIAASGGKVATADFLRSLAAALRVLNVTHRSATERTRLLELRVQAAVEVEEAGASDEPKWAYGTDKDGAGWLRWAFEVDENALSTTQGELKAGGYERLSEFIGVGEPGWIRDEPSPDGDGGKRDSLAEETQPAKEESAQAGGRGETNEPEAVEPVSAKETVTPAEENVPKPVAETRVEPEGTAKATANVEKQPAPVPAVETRWNKSADTNQGKSGDVTGRSAEPKGVEAVPDAETGKSPCAEKASAWEGKSIQDAAKAVVAAGAEVDAGAIGALAAKLAADGEYALAYHLMLNAADLGDMTGLIPAWVFGAVACGSSMQSTDQSAIAVLQGFFEKYRESLFDELEGTDRMAARLLLAAGAMEPALFFPITGAVSVLQSVHLHQVSAFKALVDEVAAYGARGVGVPRAQLFSVVNADDLREKREGIQARAKEWLLERAPHFDTIYKEGRETWRSWISSDGPAGMLLGPVVAGDAEAVVGLGQVVEQYSSDAAIDREARRIYRSVLRHRGDILRPALNAIRRHTAEAIGIANEWIGVVESQPDGRQRFDQRMLGQLRRCFVERTKQARVELKEMSGESCPVAVRAGALACLRVVDELARVLEGHGTESGTVNARSAHRLLNDDLLRVTGLRLDENGEPRAPVYTAMADPEAAIMGVAIGVVKSIAEAAVSGLPTLAEAAKARGEAGDHGATSVILRLLDVGQPGDVAKRAEQERAQSIIRHREAAQRRLTLTQRALSDALTKGLFDTEEYDRWAVRLQSAEQDMRASDFARFADVYLACDLLTEELGERKTREIARLRKDVERLNPSDALRSRLEAVLAAGDVHTATDYMDRIRDQIELPEETEDSPFVEFFGKGDDSACELIERELRETNAPVEFIARVAKREQVAGLQLKEMQTTQAKEAAEFLRLWFRVKSDRGLSEPHGSNIFTFFGMHPRRMAKSSDSRRGGPLMDVWELQVDPLESRDLCPFAGFGSGAHGHYKVVGYWRRPAAEDILQQARQFGGGPLIVLFFGRMNAAERRSLVTEQGRGDVIVIDDVLAAFLAGQRKGRLRALFLCTLPFARISPYTTVGGLHTPEMFYGRHREIRELLSTGTDSSCLLYGGRQIGKTVLLRHVQRLFEAHAGGVQVATYIDLKGKEIGTNRPMDEVWLVIAEELEKKKVITGPIGRQVKYEWLFARIEEWLAGDAKRHLLVLLDEADEFLKADAQGQNGRAPFSACTVLKDLMERSRRRFKLVLAGLHNVQKTTKVSNNPLAHFGKPICIGAMKDAGEAREAEALITQPLAAAGYIFESADLPARILAQTNYYPNLIQIYCDALLKYMHDRSRVLFPPDKAPTPPYTIMAKTLEDVYERHELREELRLRFKWTLELDRQFELIANILAVNDVDCTVGLDVPEIQQQAQQRWEKGFCGKDGSPLLTYEGFRDLLEEMVGLGILRRAEPPDHYALRNPNVLNLIGSRDAVMKLLDDAHKWERVDEYDASKFRGQISEKDKALRSPLNAAQEAKFKSGTNQVCVVCGCPAGHVEKVGEAISYRFGRDGFVRVLKGHENLEHFQEELTKLGSRKSGGTTLIVVPDSVRWDRNWIAEATKRVSRFTKAKGTVCVVFVAGPERVLPMVPDIVRKKYEGVSFITVEPWDDSTVSQWLQEAGHTAVDAAGRQCLADTTGNWPVLLEEAVKLAKGSVDNAEGFRRKVGEVMFRADRKQELHKLFGLADAVLGPLRFLGENGPGWSPEEISGLSGDGDSGVGVEHVTNVLIWAEHLGLARRGPDGWGLDPGVKQVLSMG